MGQFGVMIGQLVGFLIMLMVGYGCASRSTKRLAATRLAREVRS